MDDKARKTKTGNTKKTDVNNEHRALLLAVRAPTGADTPQTHPGNDTLAASSLHLLCDVKLILEMISRQLCQRLKGMHGHAKAYVLAIRIRI